MRRRIDKPVNHKNPESSSSLDSWWSSTPAFWHTDHKRSKFATEIPRIGTVTSQRRSLSDARRGNILIEEQNQFRWRDCYWFLARAPAHRLRTDERRNLGGRNAIENSRWRVEKIHFPTFLPWWWGSTKSQPTLQPLSTLKPPPPLHMFTGTRAPPRPINTRE